MKVQDGQVAEWSSNAKSEVESLRNVILLLRNDLEFLYGPLHRRLYFQCDVNSTVSNSPAKGEVHLKKKGGIYL
jgi:hypothetical protein